MPRRSAGATDAVRVHVCQHVPFEPPGAIADWAVNRGHDLTRTRLHADDALPDPATIDWLVVMGGPMGAYDMEEYPWLADERQLIAAVAERGDRVLGICLGAQQVAAALGAEVYPADATEIGWGSVTATPEVADTVFEPLGDAYQVLHWHGDTFDLPDGATRTARSTACTNQAFVAREGRVVGLQFHLEITPDIVDGLVEAADDLGGPGVQDAATIRDGTHRIASCNRRLRTLDELAVEELRKGFLKLRRTVQERMSVKDPDELAKIADLINSKSISSAIDHFFGRSELSQVVDQTNCLSQMTHERRLSALGPGGLNRKRAGFEVRDVHISHYGRICPIETPEGTNIGLIASLGIYSMIDEYGFLLTPYREVKDGQVNGQVKYLRADEARRTRWTRTASCATARCWRAWTGTCRRSIRSRSIMSTSARSRSWACRRR